MEAAEFRSAFRALGGFDYARAEHHVVVMDPEGKVLLSRRLAEKAEDWAELARVLEPLKPLAMAIETNNGPAVERMLAMGITVYPMNPKAAERFRDRKCSSGAKDDARDAFCFADALRSDGPGWRSLPPEDERTQELRLLCRDEIGLIGQRTALVNQMRAALVEYYPTALEAFEDWTAPSSWQFVLQFPTPRELLRRGQRQWENFLHAHHLWRAQSGPARLERFARAMELGNPKEAVVRAKSLLAVTLAKQLLTLEPLLLEYRRRIQELYGRHPDHDLFDSLPGIGDRTRNRLLGEIGSDRERFDSPEALQAYAGTAPVTRQSGKSRTVHVRYACSKWLRNAVHWLSDLSRSDCLWAQVYYQRKREQGMTHQAALRCLGQRWLKILWKMLQTEQKYDPERHLRSLIHHGSWTIQRLPSLPTAP
jgi:transposase